MSAAISLECVEYLFGLCISYSFQLKNRSKLRPMAINNWEVYNVHFVCVGAEK